jgi:hypothetical protein
MKRLTVLLALFVGLALVGCAEDKPPELALPKVTLVTREVKEDTITLRFQFTELARARWTGKVLRAQLVKAGEESSGALPAFADPAPEFTLEVDVCKPVGSETALFVARWGKSSEGIIGRSELIDLPVAGGKLNSVTLSGMASRHVTQILQVCTGPNRAIPFDPEKGVDLLTLGFAPEAYSLRVWAEKRSVK